MKTHSVVLILGILLLAACAPTQQTTTPQAPSQPSQEQPPAQQIVQEPVKVVPTPVAGVFDNLAADLRKLIDAAPAKEAEGISFTYTKIVNSLPADKASQGKVYLKGTVMKIVLSGQFTYDKATFIDEVILDTKTQTAKGYCNKISVCGPNTPVERAASYATYAFPTPISWYEGLKNVESLQGETLSNRQTYKLSATKDGQPLTVWIDKYSGIPMQAQEGDALYKYESLALDPSVSVQP